MLNIFKRITEYLPPHPDKVVLKNQHYPSGLKESDLYNYYIKNKRKILNQVGNRELMFFLQIGNDVIVRRKDSSGKFLKLNSRNYEDLITGRLLSIHSTMSDTEEFGIIDIDSDNFQKAKKATTEVHDHITGLGKFQSVKIKYTGKESFHVVCFYGRKLKVVLGKAYLRTLLDDRFVNKYNIDHYKRTPNEVNLDLSSNKTRGGFITLHSLSVEGLKCMEIPRDRLNSFTKREAKIK